MLHKKLHEDNKSNNFSKVKKTLAGVLFASGTVMNPVDAQAWFNVNAHVDVNSNVVQATVSNNSSRHWYCRGRAFGQLNTYQWISNDFYFDVPPNQYRYGYVNSGRNSYFIAGDAQVQCRSR